jgi:hypothetical protein
MVPLPSTVPPDNASEPATVVVPFKVSPPADMLSPPSETMSLAMVADPAPLLANEVLVIAPPERATVPLALFTVMAPAVTPPASTVIVESGVPRVTLSPI